MKPAPDPDDIGQILVSARSFAEYQAMFALCDDDLSGPVLDCPGGGSGFVAEAARRGVEAWAADPVYARPVDRLADLVLGETARGTAHTVAGTDRYCWNFYGSAAEHASVRAVSARSFVDDLRACPGRYVPAALANLPFADGQFQLVLSSHFLFTYADRLDATFHLAAISELCRVTHGEVRVFPLVDQAGRDCGPLVDEVRADLFENGTESEIRAVGYEFQRGGNRMLVLSQPAGLRG